MRLAIEKKHLRLVVSGPLAAQIPAATAVVSTITIEIGATGSLQKLEVNLRKEDALQAIHGLAMAHLRALDLLTH